MKVRRTLIGLALITILYLLALGWADSRNQVFAQIPAIATALPALMGMALLSYLVRYTRWRWLLGRADSTTPWFSGFYAYLSGFAFTATPGKVGELIRIRYLQPIGVPPSTVFGAFVYERAFDLISVLALSCLALTQTHIFPFVLGFVALFLGLVVLVASHLRWLGRASALLRRWHFKRLARLTTTLKNGLQACRLWLTPLDMLVSLALGVLAWSITAFSFTWLLTQLNISIAFLPSLAIYPLAMLAGAASMMPGGVGSTEVTIVALLAVFGVSTAQATLAAVGIRFATLWFAVLCGLAACGVLERRG